jgi:hypothetical protein
LQVAEVSAALAETVHRGQDVGVVVAQHPPETGQGLLLQLAGLLVLRTAPQVRGSLVEQPHSRFRLDVQRLGMVDHNQHVRQQPSTGRPGRHLVARRGKGGTDQPECRINPRLLARDTEAVADHRLDQPVHRQRALGDRDQGVAAKRGDRLVEGQRPSHSRTQRLRQYLGVFAEQGAGDVVRCQERAQAQQLRSARRSAEPV